MTQVGPPDPFPRQSELDYALGWFTHHASQRLQTFNFYLVVGTVLLLGYRSAVHDYSRWFAALLCFIGLIVTLLFFQLEVRNTELVAVGRKVLADVEREGSLVPITALVRERTLLGEALGEGLANFRLHPIGGRRRASWRWRQAIATHAFVLRSVMGFGASLFFVGLVLAVLGWVPGSR